MQSLQDLKSSHDPYHQFPAALQLEMHAHTPDSHGQQHAPITIGVDHNIQEHEEVEENLNIMDKEKELIIKALKKHNSKRKDAALDLGISERTLYRKLKEYDIEEL